MFDEIADFDGVAKGIDGGVGAMVHTLSDPPVAADQINLADTTAYPPAGAAGLNGSAEQVMADDSLLQTWADVEMYAQRIRSPRQPSNLDPTKVTAGAALFAGAGNCQGCHGGTKWTVSRRFYDPSGATNEALKTTSYESLVATFPAALLPAPAGSRFMRFVPQAGDDQIQCVLRNVGTYGISPADVNVLELRANMTTPAQGGLTNSVGYNVPSILGMQVGGPYFHAGNARTLEELLSDTFGVHAKALADAGFLTGGTAAADREALVQYLLSIDETTNTVALPLAPGVDGGSICAPP